MRSDDFHNEKVSIVMLTGDNAKTANTVAQRLGLERVIADVLPDQKVAMVKDLQADGRVVAMAGDGVNDAPALAQAQVGIAMGTGTDVAMESAAVTLVKGDLRGIATARALSRATMKNIRQNLLFLRLRTTRWAYRLRRVFYTPCLDCCSVHDCGGGDVIELGFCD